VVEAEAEVEAEVEVEVAEAVVNWMPPSPPLWSSRSRFTTPNLPPNLPLRNSA
jgi:hypothetical protein